MSPARRICETIHIVALAIWLGSLIFTGVAAAVLFPTMRDLAPALPGYAQYSGAHWSIAAGHVASRLFFATDVVQFASVLVAGLTFGLAVLFFGLSQRRSSTFARAVLLMALIGTLSYQFFVLSPDMDSHLHAYWLAAQAGDNAGAEAHKSAFDAKHPTARVLLSIDAALVLGALLTGLWSITGVGAPGPRQDQRDAGAALEEPRLARTRP